MVPEIHLPHPVVLMLEVRMEIFGDYLYAWPCVFHLLQFLFVPIKMTQNNLVVKIKNFCSWIPYDVAW